MLGFLGSVAIKDTEQKLAAWLTLPLLQFGLGVFFGSAGFAIRYLSQACYKEKLERWGDRFRNAAFIFAFIAYGMFIFGIGDAYLSFKWRFYPDPAFNAGADSAANSLFSP